MGTLLLGRYMVEAKLAQGGTSAVYRGVHESLGRTVAIKVMHRDISRRPDMAKRLLQEGRAMCRIRHENIADVTDFGATLNGDMVLVMEYLEGETLDMLVEREGALPWRRARAIALQICAGTEAAHLAGVIHRDLTLANCMRVPRAGDDFVKLIDFGIACPRDDRPAVVDGPRLTSYTEIFGTPEFMPPEQARSARLADVRSDIYAIGVQLYALVTGRVPFQGPTAMDTLVMQMHDTPVAPSQLVPQLSAAVDRVILRAMAKDPGERYQSIAELVADLREISEVDAVVVEDSTASDDRRHVDAAIESDRDDAPSRPPSRGLLAMLATALLAIGYLAGFPQHAADSTQLTLRALDDALSRGLELARAP
ncbi:MAG TPA: serine/threonine-protein kinase [Nannocystaceae bacterium]|nr:serine/threonine-protein kinase [Nannocystaceae bacterium]